jgi:hypothetical protein
MQYYQTLLKRDNDIFARTTKNAFNNHLKTPNMSKYEQVIALAIICYGMFFLCLPIAYAPRIEEQYPWWAKRITFDKVILHEALFIFWFVLFGVRYSIDFFLRESTVNRLLLCSFVLLALWCGLISLQAPLPWLDLGRTFRLLLNAALFIAVTQWAQKIAYPLMIAAFLGLLGGCLINLIISYQFPYINNGVIRLSGQATAGVTASLAIHFGAWIYFYSRNKIIDILSVAATTIFILTSIISFSRVGWLICMSGLVSWCIVTAVKSSSKLQWSTLTARQFLPILIFCFELVLLAQININDVSRLTYKGYMKAETDRQELGISLDQSWVKTLVEEKIKNQSTSNSYRQNYFIATYQIIKEHPFGVGYSGFYDAILETQIYKSGDSAPEYAKESANPHSTFLWYTTTGGFPGLVLIVVLYLSLINVLALGMYNVFGTSGIFLFLSVALSYTLMGLTIPYLINSIILIAPAAIFAAQGNKKKHLKRKLSRRIHAEKTL